MKIFQRLYNNSKDKIRSLLTTTPLSHVKQINFENNIKKNIYKTEKKNSKLGFQYSLEFRLAQHNRDVKLLENISSYFNCGKVYTHSGNVSLYRVLNFKDIFNIIIPFYIKTSFYGVKSLNFFFLDR